MEEVQILSAAVGFSTFQPTYGDFPYGVEK